MKTPQSPLYVSNADLPREKKNYRDRSSGTLSLPSSNNAPLHIPDHGRPLKHPEQARGEMPCRSLEEFRHVFLIIRLPENLRRGGTQCNTVAILELGDNPELELTDMFAGLRLLLVAALGKTQKARMHLKLLHYGLQFCEPCGALSFG